MAATTHTATAPRAQARPNIIARAKAKARGLKRFFTGKPCKRGHVAERYVADSKCCACVLLKVKAWCEANPERNRANLKAYREANLDRRRAKMKALREANRATNEARREAKREAKREANAERRRARKKVWYAANRENESAKAKARYKANPDPWKANAKAWRAANRDRYYASYVKRQLLIEQQTPAWANPKAIAAIYRDCPSGMHVDHVVPINGKSVCGLHCPANLQYLSDAENLAKHNRFPSDGGWSPAELRAMRAATTAATEADARAERKAALA